MLIDFSEFERSPERFFARRSLRSEDRGAIASPRSEEPVLGVRAIEGNGLLREGGDS